MIKKTNQIGSLDVFRMVAAFLVVGVHTYPFTSLSDTLNYGFVNIFSRIAVPFFLMITGYFVLPSVLSDDKNGAFPSKNIKKTAMYYLIATIIYLPLAIYAGYYSSGNVAITAVKNIFLDGTFYHLWYLPASIIGVSLIYVLGHKFKLKTIFVITITLYIVGIFGDSYYGVLGNMPVIKAVYDIAFIIFSYTRNGLLYAPVFLMLGAIIAKSERELSKSVLITALAISLCMLMTEGFLLKAAEFPRHDSMYIMLLPCSYFLFRLLLSIEMRPAPSLRDISLWIYILHPLFIALLPPIARTIGMTGILIDNSMVNYLVICTLSIISATVINVIKMRKKRIGS